VLEPKKVAIPAVLGAVLAVFAACSSDDARECRVGADCASGACNADGTCVRTNGAEAGASSSSGNPAGDAGDVDADLDGGPMVVTGCVPNKDGTITVDEVRLKAGLHATFQVATDEEVSTQGVVGQDGKRTWDFSQKLASDVSTIIQTQPMSGKWYAGDFASASYASKLSETSTLLGVFQTGPGALEMLGVVSPDDGLYKTRLTYDPPVAVLSFPLKADATWKTDASVSGLASGVIAAYSEKYESKVDAAGVLKTPLGSFDVLRVQVLLTRTVGLLTTTVRSFAFVTECYGTVATVTSKDNEANVEFTRAKELRRIAP